MKKYTAVFFIIVAFAFVHGESLEIHHFGIGQGDGTLIIAKHADGQYTTILVDAGNSSGKGRAIFRRMQELLGSKYKRLDCLVVSHLHSDHYGGATELLTAFQEQNWKVGIVIDKGKKTHGVAPFIIHDCCYDSTIGDPYFDNDPVDEFAFRGASLDDFLKKASEFPRKNIDLGVDLFQLTKKVKTKMKMTCVASNVKVYKSYGSKYYIDYEAQAHSENDYSYGFLMQFEGFKYFTSGDLGGKAPAYLDIESLLMNYFKTWPEDKSFHFCALKVNHHGSAHSTNVDFANFTRPTISIIQSALRSFSGTQLPNKETIDNLEDVNSRILYTYLPENGSSYWQGKVKYYKDVVLKIPRNPGYNKNIKVEIQTHLREKTGDLHWVGDSKNYSISCTKKHSYSRDAQEIETMEEMATTTSK
ncbi:ComEC/Rec2 family competence protein [Candidatus Uabimicrobium sp. HlEnr_7]|uniref:ComEC/Rec2 family competence protein n=1 Tax=Candidatus Uabimicrobium helgolandensis TaxID=3095367 RepID=UPI0035564806